MANYTIPSPWDFLTQLAPVFSNIRELREHKEDRTSAKNKEKFEAFLKLAQLDPNNVTMLNSPEFQALQNQMNLGAPAGGYKVPKKTQLENRGFERISALPEGDPTKSAVEFNAATGMMPGQIARDLNVPQEIKDMNVLNQQKISSGEAQLFDLRRYSQALAGLSDEEYKHAKGIASKLQITAGKVANKKAIAEQFVMAARGDATKAVAMAQAVDPTIKQLMQSGEITQADFDAAAQSFANDQRLLNARIKDLMEDPSTTRGESPQDVLDKMAIRLNSELSTINARLKEIGLVERTDPVLADEAEALQIDAGEIRKTLRGLRARMGVRVEGAGDDGIIRPGKEEKGKGTPTPDNELARQIARDNIPTDSPEYKEALKQTEANIRSGAITEEQLDAAKDQINSKDFARLKGLLQQKKTMDSLLTKPKK